MLTNRAVFVHDPLTTSIPNDGVAKVVEPRTEEEWRVLRYEFNRFVCDGEYRRGLERILSTFLRNLGEPTQPAAWVSGFYGSGKSHLVRMLEFLWRDVEFPDGARARGLVTLPEEIAAHFQELGIRGNQEGGLWSVGGTLGAGAGDSVRLAMLGIVLRGAGLPEKYPLAQFVLWLEQEGLLATVRVGVEQAGKSWDAELGHMYVSPVLAQSLLAAYPGFAENEAAARQLLKTQYPIVNDISDGDLTHILDTVLGRQSTKSGKYPLTLIILDELQQYLADNPERILRVQNTVEAICSRFQSRLLFVATGQSALQASPQMSRLQGRFTVQVALSDKDVETVVREVVLRKAPSEVGAVREVLDRCSGEVDRHLVGTKIGPSPADTGDVKVADYPLLPVRRRFWERTLRAVDRAGAAGQLRTQLRVVHETVREIAEQPLGTVVATDRVYGQLAPTMLQTGALLKDVDEIIRRQDDGTADGRLRSRLCSLIFLISQLPTDPGADIGVRATTDALADLLVDDLLAGSAALRQRIPELLAGMEETGDLMRLGEEYRLQTRESAEWEQEYKNKYAAIFANEPRIADDRTRALKTACSNLLRDVAHVHGASKTPRKTELFFTAEAPPSESGAVPVWIRDDWAVTEKTVREDAQAAGADSPTIFVHLPRRSSDDLKRALAGYAAATETLQRPAASNAEAQEARQGMATRQGHFREQIGNIVATILKDAKVFQGGGVEVVANDFHKAVESAMKASLERLYPDFAIGDDPRWDTVKNRVRQGSGDALSAVGFPGEAKDNPVCQRVLTFVGAGGKKGIEVRKRFTGPPFGWPQDAGDGAILALVAAGQLRATFNGSPIAAQQIDQSRMGQTELRAEGVTVTAGQRIEVKGLLAQAGVPCKSGEEALAIPTFVTMLSSLAQSAGGAAPLPMPPDTAHLEELRTRSGNEAVMAAFEQKDRLAAELAAWQVAGQKAQARLPRWHALERLLKHAERLPVHADVAPQVAAIRSGRTLLAEPDPVPPLCSRLCDALRDAVNAARTAHLDAYGAQVAALEEDPVWQKLGEADQTQIRRANGLEPLEPLDIATEEKLLKTLDATPLAEWENKTAAIAERVTRALLEAARQLEPKAVRVNVPAATLKTTEDVTAYLERVRDEIMQHIAAGVPVVV